jgi:hypothetical protein
MVKARDIKAKLRDINWLYKSFLKVTSFFISENFSDIECFCLFIGYPFSGHTIIGSLLDAHPEIIISIEADVLGLIEKGYSGKLLYHYILRNNKNFQSKHKTSWLGYSYKVPGQYQGAYKKIRIIGDKKGAKSTNHLMNNADLLSKLEKLMAKPVKMVHVVRNPLDNIASILLRAKEKKKDCGELFFKERVDYFFRNSDFNKALISKYPSQVITIHHEDFIKDPTEALTRLLLFLNIAPSENYLENCSSIVAQKPHITRDLIEWPDGLREETVRRMKDYSFFAGYL